MYKLVLNLLAFFCLFMAVTASNCVVNYNGAFGASGQCHWQWRNSGQCADAFNYMKEQLSCSSGSGSGCSYTIGGCGKLASIHRRCTDIRGTFGGPSQAPASGQC